MKWFSKKDKKVGRLTPTIKSEGLVIFDTVEDAILAEKVLRRNNMKCCLVAPPPSLRKGCDLALEINLIEQAAVEKALFNNVPFLAITPLSGTTELINIIKVYDYDEYTMVKTGNMKITFAKKTGIIVNTSGGGCPDIPYLHIQIVGKKLNEIPRPREIGHTLCALMLDRAVEGALEIWDRGETKCS